jgi:hypothetical protein
MHDNRKICIAVDNQGATLLLLISLTDRGWKLAAPTLKPKAVEAHRREQLGQQAGVDGRKGRLRLVPPLGQSGSQGGNRWR